MKLVLAALFGALAIFLWEFVAHMFLPLGEAGLGYMPNVDAVTSALQSAIEEALVAMQRMPPSTPGTEPARAP